MIIRFDTWKHSAIYGWGNFWSNRWYLDVAVSVKDCYPVMQYLMTLEAQMHHDHVYYSHCTAVDPNNLTEPLFDYGNNGRPAINDLRGAIGTPAQVAPYEYCKRVRKFPYQGRTGLWWFRGGLSVSEIAPATSHAHAGLLTKDPWDGIARDWVEAFRIRGAVIQVSLGSNVAHTPTSYLPVTNIRYEGLTIAKASQRSQARITGPGPDIYEQVIETTVSWRDHVWTVGTWWNTGSNFVPASVKTVTLDKLADLRTLFTRVGNYADDPQQSGSEQAQAAYFRWEPNSDRVSTLCSTAKDKIQTDSDVIGAIQPFTGGDGQQYLTHNNVDDILNRLTKYMAILTELSTVDYRNPGNNQPIVTQ